MFEVGDKVKIQKKYEDSDGYGYDHTHYIWRIGTIIDIDYPFITVKYRKIYNSSDHSTDSGYEKTFDMDDYNIKLMSKNKKYIQNELQKEKEASNNFKQWLLKTKNMTHSKFFHLPKEYKKLIEREYNRENISEDDYDMYDSDNFRKKVKNKSKTNRKPIKNTKQKRIVLKKTRKK